MQKQEKLRGEKVNLSVIKHSLQRFIASVFVLLSDVNKHRKTNRTHTSAGKNGSGKTKDDSSKGWYSGRGKSESIGRKALSSSEGFLQPAREDSKRRKENKVSKLDLTLLFFLSYFVMVSIFYYLDGGLLASHVCINDREITQRCLDAMELAK